VSGVDVDGLSAIDVHVHVLTSVSGRTLAEGSPEAAVAGVFQSLERPTLPEIAAYYRQRRMACVVFCVDALTATGEEPPVTSEEVAEQARRHPDVVIPFASVDPGRGRAGVRLARRLIDEYQVRGFKFHPSLQRFYPNDRAAYPLYEVIAEHRLPALFHTGHTGVGAGQPGGGGIRLKYANPIHLDDVAADFPEMPIVMAHPAFPWQDEAISIALHKPQVYIDLSGWSPKYFPPQLVRYADTLLRDKVLFGTDYPALTPDRWLRDFEQLEIRPEVRPLILKENAARLLGLRRPA
jgi:predicted TIM-barrel fold metal-dependent hydrolase